MDLTTKFAVVNFLDIIIPEVGFKILISINTSMRTMNFKIV